MKNYLALVLSVMIVSSSAYASKARLEALGENNGGSLYIKDARNMFYNPAFINDYKKKMFLEFGSASQASDTTAAPKAEGGFTNNMGDFAYGLYLGRESERTLTAVNGFNTAASTSFLAPDNAIDFFFGGDAGVKWGLNLLYAGNENKASGGAIDKTASQLVTRFGVVAGQAQVFATVGVMSKSKGDALATDELKGKLALDLGGAYDVNDNWTGFVKYTMNGIEYDPAATKAFEQDNMTVEAGMGYKKDVTKSVNMFSRVEVGYASQKTKTTATSAETTDKQWNLPLTIGAEAQALSWLAVRGSVAQSLVGQSLSSAGARAPFADTQVAAGVGMTFGDVNIDGLVATSGGANDTTVGNGGANAATSNHFGFGDQMIGRVGLTYNF